MHNRYLIKTRHSGLDLHLVEHLKYFYIVSGIGVYFDKRHVLAALAALLVNSVLVFKQATGEIVVLLIIKEIKFLLCRLFSVIIKCMIIF